MSGSKWEKDSLQFPRLLAEIRAIGLTQAQYNDLCASMDLTMEDIDELLERAETAWQKIKQEHFDILDAEKEPT